MRVFNIMEKYRKYIIKRIDGLLLFRIYDDNSSNNNCYL